MSTRRRFTEEFKLEAVKQLVQRGFGVRDVAARLGTSPHSLYALVNKYGIPAEQKQEKISLITSKCFTPRLGAIVTTMDFLR